MKRALILVDLQNDFMPGGNLAVPDGDQTVPVANQIMKDYCLVVATQDWHPANHKSFASHHTGEKVGNVVQLDGLQQVLWPDHCVCNTRGAELAAGLLNDQIDHIVYKGTDENIDSYSGFYDNGHRKSTGLDAYLKEHEIQQIDIMGLATDYCVKFTALDAAELGYETRLILEGCRGVELNVGDCETAISQMRQAGVTVL